MTRRSLKSLRRRLLAACVTAPVFVSGPAYALDHNDADPTRTITSPPTQTKTKVVLVDNKDGKGGQFIEVPISWWEDPGLIETVDDLKDVPKDVAATSFAVVTEYFTKSPVVANAAAKAVTEAVEVVSNASIHDKGEVDAWKLGEKVALGAGEGALSNIPAVKNFIKAQDPVTKIGAETLNALTAKAIVGGMIAIIKGEKPKLPDPDKDLGKSVTSTTLEAATGNNRLAKPVIKIVATIVGNGAKDDTVSVPKAVKDKLAGNLPTDVKAPVEIGKLPDTLDLPDVATLPGKLPGAGNIPGGPKPGGYKPKTPGTPGTPGGTSQGPGNSGTDKNWDNGSNDSDDDTTTGKMADGGRDGDGDTGTAVDLPPEEIHFYKQNEKGEWVEFHTDPTGTQGGGGMGPGGMKDVIANGKNGIGVGSGASGGFNNGDYDALDFVTVSVVEGEWGSVFSSPIGQSGSSSGKGPDAKGNPNPMKPGGSVMNESEIRIWDTQHGGLGYSPVGANPTGFTGGKGSKGPVNDDDKMPNPFDDNSPGGPASKGAVGASKGGLGGTFKPTGIKKVALR